MLGGELQEEGHRGSAQMAVWGGGRMAGVCTVPAVCGILLSLWAGPFFLSMLGLG